MFAEAVGSNLPGVADGFRSCFGFDSCSVEPGEPTPLSEVTNEGFDGPGLVATLDVEGDRMAVLIPAGLPLPDWIDAPDESETTRLKDLAFELQVVLLPPGLETTATETRRVDNLWSVVEEGDPDDTASAIDLTVDLGEIEAGATVRVVWPLAASVTPTAETEPAAEAPAAETPVTPPPATPTVNKRTDERVERLAGIRVPLAVRLAEKQIDVRQLIELTPGALVTFEKNCEAPLELYVNNRRFAVGEAVKIGEKFGLKIDEYAFEKPE